MKIGLTSWNGDMLVTFDNNGYMLDGIPKWIDREISMSNVKGVIDELNKDHNRHFVQKIAQWPSMYIYGILHVPARIPVPINDFRKFTDFLLPKFFELKDYYVEIKSDCPFETTSEKLTELTYAILKQD